MTEDELTQVHESPMSGLSKKYSSLDQLALPALDKTRQDNEYLNLKKSFVWLTGIKNGFLAISTFLPLVIFRSIIFGKKGLEP